MDSGWIWEKVERSQGQFLALILWVQDRQRLKREQQAEGKKEFTAPIWDQFLPYPHPKPVGECFGITISQDLGSFINSWALTVEGMLHMPKSLWDGSNPEAGCQSGDEFGKRDQKQPVQKKSRKNKPKWIKKGSCSVLDLFPHFLGNICTSKRQKYSLLLLCLRAAKEKGDFSWWKGRNGSSLTEGIQWDGWKNFHLIHWDAAFIFKVTERNKQIPERNTQNSQLLCLLHFPGNLNPKGQNYIMVSLVFLECRVFQMRKFPSPGVGMIPMDQQHPGWSKPFLIFLLPGGFPKVWGKSWICRGHPGATSMSFHLGNEFPVLVLALELAESHPSCQSPKARPGSGMLHSNVPPHHPIPGERRNMATLGWQHWKSWPFPSWNLWSCWHHFNSCSIMKEFSSFTGNSDRIRIQRRKMVPSKGTRAHGEQHPWIHSLCFPREFQMNVGPFHT